LSALHLVYQHWFITILLLVFGVTPALAALGGSMGVIIKRGGSR